MESGRFPNPGVAGFPIMNPAHRALISAILLSAAAPIASAASTLENLNAAYQRESNQVVRYEAFARRADEEKHTQAAKLFRATAASEAIHRDIQKRAILKLGGHIEAFKLAEATAATTEENLKSSIKEETEESVSYYPKFVKSAKAEGIKAATRAFNYSLAAEKRHAGFFQQALDGLAANTPIHCYVCKDCGLLLTTLPARKCPLCNEGLKAFKTIS